MGAVIRAYDWARTPLGPIETWPPALRIPVGMMVNSRFPKAIVWGPELTTIHNDAFRPILGDKEALGRSFRDVWNEVWDQIGPIAEKAFAGEATFIEDFPLLINRNGYPEQTYFTFCYSPIRDENGRVVGIMDTVIETTSKVETQRKTRLLNAELAHRIKNTLATIAAIANQTARTSATKEEMQERLSRRLIALGNAHSLLTQSSWASAPLADVIENALAPHRTGANQISIGGPPVHLSAKQSLALSLAINELATNALKYGALSTPQGRVTIAWTADEPGGDGPFTLSWTERGGPPVKAPKRRGFGSTLIDRSLAADFGGEAKIHFDPEGVRLTLATSMKRLRPDESEAETAA